MAYTMKGSPAKLGTIQGTAGHASALKHSYKEAGKYHYHDTQGNHTEQYKKTGSDKPTEDTGVEDTKKPKTDEQVRQGRLQDEMDAGTKGEVNKPAPTKDTGHGVKESHGHTEAYYKSKERAKKISGGLTKEDKKWRKK